MLALARRLAPALAPWVAVALLWALMYLGHLVPPAIVWVAAAVVIGLIVREATLAPARFAGGER